MKALCFENATFVVASDWHLEHGNSGCPSSVRGKVLTLCGDILQVNLWDTPRYEDMFNDFWETVSSQFDHVLYVMGNHEYYGSAKEDVANIVRKKLSPWPNVILLDDEHIDIDGVRYIGSTLWADANKHNPGTVYSLSNIREFSVITSKSKMIKSQAIEYEFDYSTMKYVTDSKGYRIVKSRTTVEVPAAMGVQGMLDMHSECLAYLSKALAEVPNGMPVVVLTHHAPSLKSVRPPFNTPSSFHLNGMFASNCEQLIEAYKPVVWVHGHLHNKIGYMIGDTRVVVSTKGYPSELLVADWQPTGVNLSKNSEGAWTSTAFNPRYGELEYDKDTGHLL